MPQLGEIKYGWEIDKKTFSNKFIWHACVDCGKERWVVFSKGKPYRLRCSSCANRINSTGRCGEKSKNWKGGRKKEHGYIYIKLQPDDFFYPMVNSNGYVAEHRLVVAKHLGRCLLTWETVHHKEGCDKADNRYPQTLELLPSSYRHDALTRMARYVRKLEREIERLKRQNETG